MKKSYLLAGGLLLVVVLWVGSGLIGGGNGVEEPAQTDGNMPDLIVEAELMQAESITSYVIAQGNLEPNRVVTLKAETAGQVEEITSAEGAALTSGQEILHMRLDDRELRRDRAQFKIEEQQRNLDAVNNLRERGLASQAELDTAQVELKQAQVEMAQIELEIDKTVIRAPFDGILEETLVEVGDYISVGSDVATIVDNDPLVVKVQVPQQSVSHLLVGQPVQVSLVDGGLSQGFIRYISSRGDEATRTFRVEVEIPNPEGVRAGSSATARIPKEEVMAHFVSGALLTLNTEGDMGVKTVDRDGLVFFHPVEIEFSESGGMWVSGLPESSLVITNGQGFAEEGEHVRVANLPRENTGDEGMSGSSVSDVEKRKNENIN